MSKTFLAKDEGSGFAVAIFEAGSRGTGINDVFTNPMGSANAGSLYFHSGISFFRTPTNIVNNISLPARDTGLDCAKKKGGCVVVPSYGSATYTLASGNYSNKVVVSVDLNTNRAIAGSMFVQRVGDSSFRSVTIYSNSSGIYLEEKWFAYSGGLPALSIQIKTYILSTTTENRTSTSEALYLDSTNLRTNAGLFNSNLGYVDINTDSVTYSNGIAYSDWYCSWNATIQKQDPNVIRRWVMYDPGANKTVFFWDAFLRYDGTIEGITATITGDVTSTVIGSFTYERGTLIGTKLLASGAVDYKAYQIRRSRTQASGTRLSGAAFPNGPTLQVISDPNGVAAAFSYSFDGFQSSYGEITTFPTNTIYTLNLL